METFALISVELVFVASVILLLYRLKPKITLVPLYIFIGSNQYLQTILSGTFYVKLFDEYAISTGSIVLFCSSLFAILLIYLKEGIPQTRTLIFGIVLSNVTLTILAMITTWQIAVLQDGVLGASGIPERLFSINYRMFLVGTVVLVLDSFLIVVIYEFLVTKTRILNLLSGVTFALLGVLYFDSVAFSFGSFYGNPEFVTILISQLIGKTYSGLFFAVILCLYLKFTRSRAQHISNPGEPYDVFSILTYRNKFDDLAEEPTVFERHLTRVMTDTFDNMSEGFVSLDFDWKFTFANRRANDFVREIPGGIIGKNIWDIFPALNGSTIQTNVLLAAETGNQIEFEAFYEPWNLWFAFKLVPFKRGMSVFFQDVTKRKETEKAIERATKRSELLLNAIPDLLFVINEDGIYTDFRNPHNRYTIAPPDSYIGSHVKQIVPPELLEETLSHVRTALKTGKTSIQHYKLQYPDSLRYFESRYVKSNDSEVLAIVRDVTNETKTEHALKESEMKYRALIDQASDGILVHDFDGNILEFNRAAIEFSGYTAKEFESLSITDLLFSEDLEDLPIPFDLLREGGTSGTTRRIKRKDGSVLNMELRSKMNDRGNIIVIARDITERLEAEEEIRKRDRRFRVLTENAPVGIFQTNIEGECIYVNEYWLRVSGYTMAESLGSGWTKALHPSDKSRVLAEWEDAKANDREFSSEYQLLRKDGGTVLVKGRALALKDAKGVKYGFIGTILDITEQRKADAELAIYRENLEELVRIRTEELEVEKIKAQSADKLKSAFLATMSHELRTPLNSIIGFTGIMLSELAGPVNAEQKKQLGLVKSSGRHLLNLINDVLDLSKIEAGELILRTTTFDMFASIVKAVELVKPLAKAKNLELIVEKTSDSFMISSDQRRVEQILINLMDNAVKFTKTGSVKIHCEKIEKMLITKVSDTGIGIKPEDIEKLFKPFSQIDSGLTRNHEGTGLGLSISQKLVQRLGGSIEVETEFGKGSSFIVRLPLITTPEDE